MYVDMQNKKITSMQRTTITLVSIFELSNLIVFPFLEGENMIECNYLDYTFTKIVVILMWFIFQFEWLGC